MPSQTSIKFDLTGQVVGTTTPQGVNAGLYKYTLDATLGTASVVKPQILIGVDWLDLLSIAETAITKTDTGVVTQIFDVYLPTSQLRINVGVDTVTDGFATFSPVITNNV